MALHYKYLEATGSASVSGPVRVYRIVVGTGTASSVVSLYDGDANTDPEVAVINAAAAGSYDLGGVYLANGAFFEMTAANSKATLVYE